MNLKLWLCIGMGVFVAHLAVLMIWVHFQPQPKLATPPPTEFKARAKAFVDPDTGEKMIAREFTVTTHLATPLPSTPPPIPPQPPTARNDE